MFGAYCLMRGCRGFSWVIGWWLGFYGGLIVLLVGVSYL